MSTERELAGGPAQLHTLPFPPDLGTSLQLNTAVGIIGKVYGKWQNQVVPHSGHIYIFLPSYFMCHNLVHFVYFILYIFHLLQISTTHFCFVKIFYTIPYASRCACFIIDKLWGAGKALFQPYQPPVSFLFHLLLARSLTCSLTVWLLHFRQKDQTAL